MVGDDLRDVEGALAAGARTLDAIWGSADPSALRRASAEQTFESVAELRGFLEPMTWPHGVVAPEE